MDKQERSGFNLGIRVAARMLLEKAEELEQEAAAARTDPTLADTAQRRRLRQDALYAMAHAKILREQATEIRGITPDMVHVHRR